MSRRSGLERVFVPSSEAGVLLEIVIARPAGKGPFPTMIFHHGSTGRGQNPAMFRRSISPAVIAGHLAGLGWMTLFPQRRGRGRSGGAYGEGLAADGSGYSCEAGVALAGFDRAVEDLDAVLGALPLLPDADRGRLVVGGVSRGGILAIAHAGMRPGVYGGAVNFNGGWLGRACPAHVAVNPPLFARGGAAGIPTLWLHGRNDPYYSIGHCRANFDGFRAAGGQGVFVSAPAGHALLFKPALWAQHLDGYLAGLFPG